MFKKLSRWLSVLNFSNWCSFIQMLWLWTTSVHLLITKLSIKQKSVQNFCLKSSNDVEPSIFFFRILNIFLIKKVGSNLRLKNVVVFSICGYWRTEFIPFQCSIAIPSVIPNDVTHLLSTSYVWGSYVLSFFD